MRCGEKERSRGNRPSSMAARPTPFIYLTPSSSAGTSVSGALTHSMPGTLKRWFDHLLDRAALSGPVAAAARNGTALYRPFPASELSGSLGGSQLCISRTSSSGSRSRSPVERIVSPGDVHRPGISVAALLKAEQR